MDNFDQPGKVPRAKAAAPPPPPSAAPVKQADPIPHLPTATEIEAIYQQTREQGFEAGHAEGMVAGEAAGRASVAKDAELLAQALGRFEQSLASFDEQIAQDLLLLAQEIARQVVRRDVDLQSDSILTVIKEALQLLPHQYANIYLHPTDAALVRNADGMHLTHAGHRIHEDDKLSRGDCVLESGSSRIDATLATRWRRVVAALGSNEALDKTDDDPS